MILKKFLSFRLGLFAALLATAPLQSAQAQEQTDTVFPGKFLMQMLPAGQIVGDGSTPVTLYVTAMDNMGSPLKIARLKVTASEGKVSEITDQGDGLIKMTYTPPKVRSAEEVMLRLKGKIDGDNLTQAWSLQLVPSLGSNIATAINPAQVILGQDRTASINFSLANNSDHAGQPELKTRATAGAMSNLTYLGDGKFTALYTPPDVSYPHTALITVSDKRSPTDSYGYLAVPLVGKTDFPRRNLAANASVILRISGREFGPYTTDANGSVSIPVIVPPGVEKGTQIVVANGRTQETSIDLKVPATRRIAMMPVHDGIPGDGINSIKLRAVVIEPTGEPDPTASVRFTASSGTMSAAQHEGNGIYSASYVPPVTLHATTASISVSIDGEAGIQKDSFDIQLVPARPSGLQLTPDPAKLAPRGEGFKLFAKIRGEDGGGLSGRTITFFANGAQLRGSVKDLGNGDYEAAFVTNGRSHVDITGTAMPTATGNPLRGVVVFSSKHRLPNDGLSSSLITIVAVDEFGYPVPGIKVDLGVLGEIGSLPDTVTTDSQGLAQVFYTAGRQAGIAHIVAKAGDFSTGAAIIQAPADALSGLILPTAGNRTNKDWVSAWSGIVTQTRVEREGAEAPDIIPTADPTQVVTLQVSAQPQTAAPGGKVTLKVDARNADGRGVPGQTLDVLASQGTVSPLTDNGDGTYTAKLALGQNAKGATKIVVSTQDGALFTMMRIATVEGIAPPEEPAEKPVEKPTPTPTPSPAPSAVTSGAAAGSESGPWLRIRAGVLFGQYSYSQTPENQTDNPLYSGTVELNQAPFNGGDFSASAWIPELPWIGFDARVLVGAYTAGWPAAVTGGEATNIPDFVPMVNTSIAGRVLQFSNDGLNFYASLKAGYMYSDLLRYTWADAQQSKVNYKDLAAQGLSGGAEIGGDALNGDLFFSAALTGGFVGLSPYASIIDLEVGYVLMPNIYGSLNFNQFSRRVVITDRDTSIPIGELSDNGWNLSAGIGFQY